MNISLNPGIKSFGGHSTGLKVLISVVLGAALGLAIFLFLIGRPRVAVIDIVNGEIDTDSTVQMVRALHYARDEKTVKAVVVNLSSPGGGATDSTTLFMEMVKLREKKPVVVVVTEMAASGGYQMLLGANYVYANPSSFVGNVGVILYLPSSRGASERIVTSGPFKGTGGSERMYLSVMQMLKDAFIKLVVSQRGDRLRMSPDEVAEGRIYLGVEAVKLGLVDEMGTVDDGVKKAASLAGIRNYQLLDVNKALQDQGMKLVYARKGNYSLASFKPEFPYLYYRFVEPR
ncbi:MAG: S49 family peptidase [Chloroflexi bacterium]|nr:S49 family peptidase [Chloroflexota bacterium]